MHHKQITVEHLNEALKSVAMHDDGKYSIVDVFNKAQKLAEANEKPEPVEPTCQVQHINGFTSGEVITMTRRAAQELQVETKDTHDWFDPVGFNWGNPMNFRNVGTYTYRAKATIKLNGRMVTREQAITEWERKKETHDVWFKLGDGIWDDVVTQGVEHDLFVERLFPTSFPECEYELRAKPIKVVKWEGSRDDVIALLKEVGLI